MNISNAIELGGDYLLANGRLLEQALFQYHFQNGNLDEVLDELASFQNKDGGFGHGLESDLQIPYSSVLATSEALIRVRSLGISFHHPMVERAIQYLLDTYTFEAKCWHFVPRETDLYPRAPWWNFDPDPRMAIHNPRPQLLGDLVMGKHLVPADMLHNLAVDVRNDLIKDSETLVMHDVLSYLRLFRTPGLPIELRNTLDDLLPNILARTVEKDPSMWDGYCLQPYMVADSVDDPLFPLVSDMMAESIAFVLAGQTPDGCWLPNWSWGDQYPETWEIAKRQWISSITLDHIIFLKNIGAMVSS